MALYNATQSGYFNNPAVWGGNTPTVGDCVDARGNCIKINQNVNLGTTGGFLNSTSSSSGPETIGFWVCGSTISLTGNIIGSGSCARVMTLSGSNVDFCANYMCGGVFGGNDYYPSTVGIHKSNTIINSDICSGQSNYSNNLTSDQSSSVTINGNIICTSISIASSDLIVNGNINSGDIAVDNTSTLKICGNIFPTDSDLYPINNYGTMSVYGKIYASKNNPAVYSTGSAYVQKLISGPDGKFPIVGSFIPKSPLLNDNVLLNNPKNQILQYNTVNNQSAASTCYQLPSIVSYNSATCTIGFSKPHGLYPGLCVVNAPNTFSFCYTNQGSLVDSYNCNTGTYAYSWYSYCSDQGCGNFYCYTSQCYPKNHIERSSKVLSVLDSVSAVVQDDIFSPNITQQDISNLYSCYCQLNCKCYCFYPSGISNVNNTSFVCPYGSTDNYTYGYNDPRVYPAPPPNIIGGFSRDNTKFPQSSTQYPVITSVSTNSNYCNINFSSNTPHSIQNIGGFIKLSGINVNNSFANTSQYLLSSIPDSYTLNLFVVSSNNPTNFNSASGIAVLNSCNNASNFYYNNSAVLFNNNSLYNIPNNTNIGFIGFLNPDCNLNGTSYPAKVLNSNSLIIPVNLNNFTIKLTGTLFVDYGAYFFQDQDVSLAASYPEVSSVRLGYSYANGTYIGTMAVPEIQNVRGNVNFDSLNSLIGSYFFPQVSDVRLGTNYDINSIGKVSIPPLSSVTIYVPVDNTIGSASVVSVPTIWNTLSAFIQNNTIGDVLFNKTAQKGDLIGLI